jgi:ABC-2 type transport system permease protein
MLPEFWQTLSLANPVLYMINAFRFGLLGVSDIPLWIAFTLIAVFTVTLVGFALQLLSRGVGVKS